MLSPKLQMFRTLGLAAMYTVAMVTGTATLMAAFAGTSEAPGTTLSITPTPLSPLPPSG